MANIIDYTYFVDNLEVPSLLDSTELGTSLQSQVTRYITHYEPLYLKYLMGDDLYAAYLLTPTAARFTALKDKLLNATTLKSPIANYVYFYFYRDTKVYATGSGEGGGAVVGGNSRRVSDVWNDGVKMSYDVHEWIMDNISTYPEYSGFQMETINQFDL